jgi:hypothetical protein
MAFDESKGIKLFQSYTQCFLYNNNDDDNDDDNDDNDGNDDDNDDPATAWLWR